MRLALILVAACSQPKSVAVVPKPPPKVVVDAPKPAPPPVAESRWPVPMRVMTWTGEGVEQIGTLPDAPPTSYPTHWFVEPARALDADGFGKLVRTLREENTPGLSLRGQPTASFLPELVDLPDLKALLLDDLPLTSKELVFELRELERLYLARTQIDDKAVETIARHTKLKVLDLEDTSIGDAGLAGLAPLANLHAIDLAGTRITDAGGTALAAFGKLAILDLGGTKIAAKTIDVISKRLAITELFIDHTHAGKEISKLAAFAPGIRRFDASLLASNYKPTDTDLDWLARAPHLIEVNVSGAAIHDKLALALAAKPTLRELKLASTQVTAAAIPTLVKNPKLEEVDLANLPVDDASAAALLAMPEMRVLRLDGTPITDKAMAKPGPALVELYVSKTRVTDAGLGILDALPKLQALGLGDLGVGDVTLARIAKLTGLHTLVLSKAGAGVRSLAVIGTLASLDRLYLDDTRTEDDTIAALAGLRELRVLHLAGTSVSDASLPTLRSFRHLDELTVGDTRLTKAIANLDAWPQLRTLSLFGLEIRDPELGLVLRRRSLVTLDLSATDVTDPAPLIALPNLRTLGLSNTMLSPAGTQAIKAIAARGIEVVR
jgi:Leucine-rich repeat (LRR) protein